MRVGCRRHQALSERWQKEGRWDARLDEWRWMLEEYRVSLFAQQLGDGARWPSDRLPSDDAMLCPGSGGGTELRDVYTWSLPGET